MAEISSLLSALERLDRVLALAVARERRDPARAEFNEYRGLYVSAEEVERLCGARSARPAAAGAAEPAGAAGEAELAALATAAAGERSPLAELARLFGLTPFDADALVTCLAPELDQKYERLYAFLQDDVTRKRPTPGLVLRLLCPQPPERLAARARLAPGAPLLRHQILSFAGPAGEEPPFLSRPLRVDDRVVHFLLGIDLPDEALAPFARLAEPRAGFGEVVLPADLKQGLLRLFDEGVAPALESAEAPRTFLRLVFQGEGGTGKRLTAEALCRRLGIELLTVDLPLLLGGLRGAPARPLAERACREARLRSAALYLDGAELLLADELSLSARELLEALQGFPGLAILGSARPWPPQLPGDGGPFCRVSFAAPEGGPRRELWRELAARQGIALAPGEDLEPLAEVAELFAFGPGRIHRALAEARAQAAMDGEAAVTAAGLARACRAQGQGRLAALARRIVPLYTWEDLVLPADSLAQLRSLCAHARLKRQVFERWGFDRKVARGKGVAALFAGPSGTGKTMASEVIAGELGLDLYKIDLAAVVSKYVGETEKNLARIFDEAEASHAVLFFDEADALFGKRSQVKDAHDRYANIEINYLLQRIEEHEGTVILASNFRQNMDEAFTRRLRFIVDFPAPDEPSRRRLWERLFPGEVPLGGDVDLAFLARQFKIPGGSIKNIALAAAFEAAGNGGVVTMEHLVRATRRELLKAGTLCMRSDFLHWFDLAQEGS